MIPDMARDVWAHLSPNSFQPNDLRGGIAVVIDVLRASTTIVHALAAGARAVVPCKEVDEARRIAGDYPAGDVLLGGERGGQLIDGFDLDNSPLKYTTETVENNTIVFTTSNGTRALLRSREADRVLIGAFVNQTAVVRMLSGEQRPVHLVCAGKDADISAEDVLCAGALAAGVQSANGGSCRLNDPAQIAAGFFAAHSKDDDTLHAAIRAGRNGGDLCQLGFEADIGRAATRDLFEIVPEFLPESGRIEGPNRAASR
jgi:2-phosphosulfolactate phosphatase